MENLWKRLKPAVKKQILAEKDQYPYLVSSIKTQLENNNFWFDLSIDTARQVISFSHEDIFELSYTDIVLGDKFIKKA